MVGKVLLLSPYPETILETFWATGEDVVCTEVPLDLAEARGTCADVIVSYGYGHILSRELVAAYDGRAINLHISMLPWNRGADPNFWSWYDATPKGVTLHLIDAGIDTGGILAQREVTFADGETLAGSYSSLRAAAERLFAETWPAFRAGGLRPRPQVAGGSLHLRRDLEPHRHLLTRGWDTPVADIARAGAEARRAAAATGKEPTHADN